MAINAPTNLNLAASSDAGASNSDGITNVVRPTVTGRGPLGTVIQLYEGSVALGTGTVQANGTWSITLTSPLTEGPHTLVAVATQDLVQSAPSLPLAVLIDITPPATPLVAPELVGISDSGLPDHITNVTRPSFYGTDAEVGSTVTLYDGNTKVGSVVVSAATGAWTVAPGTALADGVHNLSVTVTDLAGNVSGKSPATTVEILTRAQVPSTPVLVPELDTGVSNSDHITKETRFSFDGTAAAGAHIELRDSDGTLVGVAETGLDGKWTTGTVVLSEGAHSIKAVATDLVGNTAASAALQLTVDVTAPDANEAPQLADGNDSGALDDDGLTNVATPRVVGKTEAGASITLFDGEQVVGHAVADGAGNWSIASERLSDGDHALHVTITDLAGNVSNASRDLYLLIDTQAPVAPAVPVLDPVSDSGSSPGDGITSVTTPRLSGTVEAYATVNLYDGNQQVASVAADGNGVWHIDNVQLAEGPHSLAVTATDAAGNESAKSPVLALIIDTTAPHAPAMPDLADGSDSGTSHEDNITGITQPVITGHAEAGATVTLFDGAARIGSTLADANGVWQITPSQALANGVHALTATATDLAGNVSSASPALNVTIDTTAAVTPTALALTTATDSGASQQDNITKLATPAVTGKAEAGAHITLFEGSVKLGTAVADGNGVWTVALDAPLSEGQHLLSATSSSLTGIESAPSAALLVTIDTTAPLAPAAPALAAAGGNLTNDARPALGGVVEAGATVTLYDGDQQIGSTVADGQGVWRITPAQALDDRAHSLTVTATDVAGNVSAASAALVLTVDTKAPDAPSAPDLADAADSGASASDNITSVTQPLLTGHAESGATVRLYDGAVQIGSAVADASGAWQITPAQALVDGPHTLTATATDAAGNVSAASPALQLIIDTSVPDKPTDLNLVDSSDSGASNSDNITAVTAPAITGKAGAGASVTVFDGAVKLGTVVADNQGVWKIDLSGLDDGVHHLTAKTSTLTGLVSDASDELVLTIDTKPPAVPAAPTLDAGQDSGASDSDGLININTPKLSGHAESNATVAVFDGASQIGSVQADGNGDWHWQSTSLADGAHSLTVKAIDAAGNMSAASPALVLVIDTVAPVKPGQPDLADASDSGTSSSDNITNVALPTLVGKAEANSSVALYDGNTLVGNGVADDSGNWQITVTQPLSNATHNLSVKATDAAGNTSDASVALSVTVAAAALAAPTLDLAAASDSGSSNSDDLTNIVTPQITGKAPNGATVTVYDGQTKVGVTTADASTGVWTLSTSTLDDRVHHLTAVASDAAGNVSAASAELLVTVDTQAPVSTLVLAAGSDTGRSGTDGITSATTLSFVVTTEPNSTVVLLDGGKQVASGTVGSSGVLGLTVAGLDASGHSLTVVATDVAGNVSTTAPLAVTIDNTAPSVPSVLDLLAISDSGTSSTDNLTNIVLPTLTGKAEANAIVTLYDGAIELGSGLADENGNWQITLSQPLAEGPRNLTAKATDVAGNTSLASAAFTVKIDTVAAAPSDLALTAASNSGLGTDNVTNIPQPTITGKAEPGATVNLYEKGILLGTAVADANTGVWSIAVNTRLDDSVHQLSAVATDMAGNVSQPSVLAVTIVTGSPDAPTLMLDPQSDSGVSSADGITKVTLPRVFGTAEAGATVTLFDGSTKLLTTVADNNGNWSVTLTTALSAATHNLTATATNVAGNVSQPSAVLAITVDTSIAPPAVPDLVAASDSGSSNTDNITNVSLPTLTGKTEANSSVALFDGAVQVGTAVADANGNYSVTASQALADGVHSLTIQATDVAGNVSGKSPALSVTIDATPSTIVPTALDLVAASDTGASSTDNITRLTTFSVTGKVVASSVATVVGLFSGDTQIGTATIAANATTWTVTTTVPLADGVYNLTARTIDTAGNLSVPSAPLAVTIDTKAPDLTVAPVLDTASESGRSASDNIINKTTPVLTGVTEVGATVTLYEGNTVLGTAVAGSNGAWAITVNTALTSAVHNLTYKVTDVAGNISQASPVLALTVDTVAPSAPTTLDLLATSDSGASSTDNLTNVAQPTLTGKAEANAIVTLYEGSTVVGSGLADASGNWQITLSQPLPDIAHTLTAKATDVAGNTSGASTSLAVTIDTVTSAPSALALAAASNSGLTTDNITNVLQPTITGKAELGATVNLYEKGILLGTAVANTSTGVWSIVVNTRLDEGPHQLTAVATDVAGNVSQPSTLEITIDTLLPDMPTLMLDPFYDSGVSNADGLTKVTLPRLFGTAEAGATVALFDGGTKLLTTVADSTGNWSVTLTTALSATIHNLTATATDVAGNVSQPSAVLAITVDTAIVTPPAPDLVAASDSGSSNTDNITSVTLPTLTGKTEANASVALFDGTVQIGTAVADGSGNWQITLSQPLVDAVHSFTIIATDVAGNVSAKSPALSVTIDTISPTIVPTALDLVTASDTGVSNTDNLTKLTTFSVSGKVVASPVATAVVLFNGDVQIGTATIAANATTWTVTTTVPLADGAYNLTARTIDTAGNLSAPSAPLAVTIDTKAPDLTVAPVLDAASESGRSASDNIINKTTPVLTGVTEVGATVTLYEGSTVLGTAVADSNGAWAITVNTALSSAVHNLTYKVTDVAGNISQASPALALTVDTVAPSAPTTLDLLATSDSGASSTDNLTNIAQPTLTGKAEANAIVTLYDGATVVGSGLADASGNWQITLSQPLADGSHTLTAKATDVAGNTSGASTSLAVTIDTVTSAPSALALAAASNSGLTTDNITNVLQPTITGKAELGATVNLYEDGILLGTAVANASTGVWSIVVNTKLAQGPHQLTAIATDVAGNVSQSSAALAVIIETGAPDAPTLVLDPLSDSGVSNADGLTKVTLPRLFGTAEAGATVTLFDGGTKLLTTVADSTGNWSVTLTTALSATTHNLTATATDVAGNVSQPSAVLVLKVDTSIATPAAPDLVAASDNGTSTTDNLTSVTLPTLAGQTEANASVALFDGAVQVGTAVADANGNYSVTASQALADGVHSLTIQATDVAGNVSGKSPALSVTIDTTPLPAPTALDLATASDKGPVNNDNITNVTTPTITGKITASSTATIVALFDGAVQVGTATVAAGATTWSIVTSKLGDGVRHLTAITIDPAGNKSAPSDALDVTIHSSLNVSAATMTTASDSGASSSDGYTNVKQPVFVGTGDIGATVSLYDNGKLLGSKVIDSTGTWSFSGLTLADGAHSITVQASDLAGNAVTVPTALAVNIDTVGTISDANRAANVVNLGAAVGSLVGVTVSGGGVGGKYTMISNPGNLFSLDENTGVVKLADAAALTSGPHAITVQSLDLAGNVATGVFTILGNTAPTIAAIGNVTMAEDTTRQIAYSVSDPESTSDLTMSYTATNNMGVTFNGDGTLTLKPDTNFYGSSTIRVTVTDSGGLSSTTQFVATVTPVNDPTVVNSDIFAGKEDGRLSITTAQLLSNDNDIADNAAAAAVVSVSPVSGGSVTLSGSTITFTASPDAHGLAHFTYLDADNVTGNVWIKLAPVNDTDLTFEIQQMYVGYFGRPADKLGLSGKMNLGNGYDLTTDAGKQAFLTAMGHEFATSPELQNNPLGGTNAEKVYAIYKNLFGLEAANTDITGQQYWTEKLDSGALNMETIVWSIGASATGVGLTVMQNKVEVAQYFTDQMNPQQNAGYVVVTESVRQYLKNVTDNNATVIAAAEGVQDAIYAATGVAARVASGSRALADTGDIVLTGTSGVDHFLLSDQTGPLKVLNFSSTGGDQLVLSHVFNGITFANAADVLAHSHVEGGNTVLDLGTGHAVTLVGVAALTIHDITLVN